MLNHPLIRQVRDAKALMERAQKALLALCRDKQYDINDRFEVWSDLIEKVDHSYIYHFQQKSSKSRGDSVSPVPEAILNWEDNCEGRYQNYSWDEIYESAEEDFPTPEHFPDDYYDSKYKGKYWAELQELKHKSGYMDEVKEWFIQENFGSFNLDW